MHVCALPGPNQQITEHIAKVVSPKCTQYSYLAQARPLDPLNAEHVLDTTYCQFPTWIEIS